MENQAFKNSYANFGAVRSARQVAHALKRRAGAGTGMKALFRSLDRPVGRIEEALGGPLHDKKILEIGPGQGMERARYLAQQNSVVTVDRDVIPTGWAPGGYVQMARANGLGRVAKTVGREVLIGRANRQAWDELIEASPGREPVMRQGDIAHDHIEGAPFDVITSWSVFEHLPDPKAALANTIDHLRPGGVFHLSIHIFTAHDGHHDIRSFTGGRDALPLWGHLRPSVAHLINPSSYLNEWRLDQWRDLFDDLAPGFVEYLDEYEVRDEIGPRLTDAERDELADYSDEELFTVNAVYLWRKPA